MKCKNNLKGREIWNYLNIDLRSEEISFSHFIFIFQPSNFSPPPFVPISSLIRPRGPEKPLRARQPKHDVVYPMRSEVGQKSKKPAGNNHNNRSLDSSHTLLQNSKKNSRVSKLRGLGRSQTFPVFSILLYLNILCAV